MNEKETSAKAAEARRAYQKEWRAKNKDKVKIYNQRFWEKQAKKAASGTQGKESGNDT